MTDIYFDDDVDLGVLKGKTIATLGYGNQGRSQALNFRDLGLNLVVGNREDSYRDQAIADGFEPVSLPEAAERGDVLLMLAPDEVQPEIYERDIAPTLTAGKALVFASGFNIYYGFIRPPETVDVVMVAPEMIGVGVRENFLNGKGYATLVGVEQDATGQAQEIALAIAKASGSTKLGAIMSSFEEETLIDLMYEHSGVLYHIRRVISVLIEAGVSPEAAIIGFYASGEEARLAQAYADIGLWHQLPLHSSTSQYGQEVTSEMLPEEEAVEIGRLQRIVQNIKDGTFAKAWKLEQQTGFPTWHRKHQQNMD
ncbi:MAG: ketol-acid reductoisomerase, partial [Candidatus Promineifilaceae bacterium]